MSTLAMKAYPIVRATVGGVGLFVFLVFAGVLEAHDHGLSAPHDAESDGSGDMRLSSADRAPADGSRSRPHQLYRTHCVVCHDTDGRGGPSRNIMSSIPDFTKAEWHRAHTDDGLVRSIREGKGPMPAMKRKLAETDVMLLVSVVRKFREGRQVVPAEPEQEQRSREPAEPRTVTAIPSSAARAPQSVAPQAIGSPNPQAEAGRAIFQRFCIACHAADGRASAMRDFARDS